MRSNEVFELCTKIKAFYQSFSFPNEKLKAWEERLANVKYEDAIKSLNHYVENDESNRPPTLAHIMAIKSKDDWHYAVLDTKRMVVVWKPEPGLTYELPIFWNGTAWEDRIYNYIWGTADE